MARRNLKSTTLKKRNTLLDVADQSKQFQSEITDETNVDELPENLREKLIYLEDDMLMDDPYNQAIYGDEQEVKLLARSMKDYGFVGIIIAYPHEGRYMIESGHRRRAGARIAGVKKYPVLVREAPKTEWERKMRLFLGNLHGRREKPMVLARTAQGLYDTHKIEIENKKRQGILESGEITALNELVAIDMELDVKSVQKYKSLLKLIPELQEMANADYSWSALTAATTLDPDQQMRLKTMIVEKTQKDGKQSVTRPWIVRVSNDLKAEQNVGEINGIEREWDKTGARTRRKNGTRVILNCAKSLHEVLDKESIIREEEVGVVLQTLERLKDSIQTKMDMLKEKAGKA